MNAVITLFRREPVLFTGLVAAAIAVAVSFGLHLTQEQKDAVYGLLAAVALIVARNQVSPVAAPPDTGAKPPPA